MGRPLSTSTETVLGSLAGRPWLTIAIAVVAVHVAFYAVFLRQELIVALWVLSAGFFAYLALRFVRARERLATAAERVAADAG